MDLVALHHENQKLIARNLVAELGPLFGILDFHDLRGTTADWLKAVRPVVEKGFLVSQYTAAQFYLNYRSTVVPSAEPLDVEVPNPLGAFGVTVEPDRHVRMVIMVAMKVTGPVHMAENSHPGMSVEDIPEIAQDALLKSSGAAVRIALNGGRGMVRTMVDADPLSKGVRSVADEDACDSCRFLASRVLLKGQATERQMNAVAVGHDWDRCSVSPIF